MKRGLALLLLAGCVTPGVTPPDGALPLSAAEFVELDGFHYEVRTEADWPVMAMGVDPATGESVTFQSGTAPTLLVFGAPDRDTAIRIRGAYCGQPVDLAGWDTQQVYRDAETGAWWFDGACG